MKSLGKIVLTASLSVTMALGAIGCNEEQLKKLAVGAGVGLGVGALQDGSDGAKKGVVTGAAAVLITDMLFPTKEPQGQYGSSQQIPAHKHGDYSHSHEEYGPHAH